MIDWRAAAEATYTLVITLALIAIALGLIVVLLELAMAFGLKAIVSIVGGILLIFFWNSLYCVVKDRRARERSAQSES